jgi:hypothetical protein
MYKEEMNLMTGEKLERPVINWNEAEKHAIIGCLLMSIDKKLDPDKVFRLDDLFGLTEDACEGETEEAVSKRKEAKEAVLSECEKFLGTLGDLDDTERYDVVADVIDKFIGNDSGYDCPVGGSYRTWGCVAGVFGAGKLEGAPYVLWDYVKLVIDDDDYSGNKRRLLKHLARKWDIEPSVLPKLETAAQAFGSIEKERAELKASDKSYREVTEALEVLDQREKDVWKTLKGMGVSECREVSEYAARAVRTTNAQLVFRGLAPNFKVDLNEIEALEEDADAEEKEGENGDFWDKAADGVCRKIDDFANWVADGINNLALSI